METPCCVLLSQWGCKMKAQTVQWWQIWSLQWRSQDCPLMDKAPFWNSVSSLHSTALAHHPKHVHSPQLSSVHCAESAYQAFTIRKCLGFFLSSSQVGKHVASTQCGEALRVTTGVGQCCCQFAQAVRWEVSQKHMGKPSRQRGGSSSLVWTLKWETGQNQEFQFMENI